MKKKKPTDRALEPRPRGEAVMNAALHERLKAAFGAVRVSRRGEARVADGSDPFADPRDTRPVVDRPGEGYHVRCCFCDDDGTSLSVNHQHGRLDRPRGKPQFLAYCHAENCLALRRNRDTLARMLGAGDGELEKARVTRQSR